MKSLKTFLVGMSALVAVSASAAKGLVTLTVQGEAATNEVQIAANQQGTVKSYFDQHRPLNLTACLKIPRGAAAMADTWLKWQS